MPRAATTTDAFNAIAEQRRREIIDVLSQGKQHAVGELVLKLGIPQPAVSKHLGVLRKVGLVTVLRQGQQRLYSLNAEPLKAVHDWVKSYERFWDEHLDAIKLVAERKARERAEQKSQTQEKKPDP
jgi:DNA-binding transcriptional ArsR family regulator